MCASPIANDFIMSMIEIVSDLRLAVYTHDLRFTWDCLEIEVEFFLRKLALSSVIFDIILAKFRTLDIETCIFMLTKSYGPTYLGTYLL